MSQRYKILITANHCAPDQGSEHGVGWNFLTGISAHHDVLLVCNRHDYIRGVIDFVQSEEGRKRNIRLFLIEQKVKYTRGIRLFPFLYYVDYRRWQKKVYRLVSELLKTERIDIIHHITNSTFREPGYLWKLDRPFVWGPVSVLGDGPVRFLSLYTWKERFKTVARRVTCMYQLRFSRRLKKATGSAAACICDCRHTAEVMHRRLGLRRWDVMPETCAILRDIPVPPPREAASPIRLLWAAGFDSRKGAILLVEALRIIQEAGDIPYRLTVAGDGICRKKIIRLCGKYSLAYDYMGRVPHGEMPSLYAHSHLFFLPSLMDATTNVVFESLANYCPVIALNHLSFSEVVDETCGRKVDLVSPRQIARDIAEYIRYFYHHEEERYQLSLGARKRAESYSLENRACRLNAIYRRVMEERAGAGTA
ncbi:MAG: glycosyltransferase family 4 protein [Tannerella sp.]|jgi:glycosyltransferase involved in cell wall biosynthesis|nr:glycosyltransferase family 4 protein [Tannerella sp.]